MSVVGPEILYSNKFSGNDQESFFEYDHSGRESSLTKGLANNYNVTQAKDYKAFCHSAEIHWAPVLYQSLW